MVVVGAFFAKVEDPVLGHVNALRGKRPLETLPLFVNERGHVRLEHACGVTFCGNSLSVGQDDGGAGTFSPACGIAYRGLRDAVIKDNVLYDAALRELLRDGGDNDASVICRDNPGRLFTPPAGK